MATSRRLLLIRHAKTEPGQPDIRRRLTERGRRDAVELGRWLEAHDAVPDLALVSPAVRAAETWEHAAAVLTTAPEVRVDDRIYDNSPHAVLDAVGSVDDAVLTLAVVGHNPTMHELAARWADNDAATDFGASFPTGSVALVEVTGGWPDVHRSAARLLAFATCRG